MTGLLAGQVILDLKINAWRLWLKKIIPYVLFIVGVLLVGGAGFYLWHASGSQSAAPAAKAATAGSVPQTIAGLPLVESKADQAALDSFKQLSGLDFPLVSVTRAQYGQNSATLWLAETSSDAQALELINQLETKIAQGGLPLSPMGVFQFKNRNVFMLNGADRTNFYIQSGKNVFWLAVLSEQTEQAMKELLAFYP